MSSEFVKDAEPKEGSVSSKRHKLMCVVLFQRKKKSINQEEAEGNETKIQLSLINLQQRFQNT